MAAINSDTGVVNLALLHLGIDPLVELDTDQSKQAEVARASYDTIRDLMLRVFTWNFAIDRRAYTADLTGPTYGFDNSFQLPDEILRIVDIENSRHEDWKVEGRKIITDRDGPLNAKGILRLDTISDWDPMFVMSLSYRCSMAWAEVLVRQSTVTEAQSRLYVETMREAISTDSLEMHEEVLDVSDWIIARSVDVTPFAVLAGDPQPL